MKEESELERKSAELACKKRTKSKEKAQNLHERRERSRKKKRRTCMKEQNDRKQERDDVEKGPTGGAEG